MQRPILSAVCHFVWILANETGIEAFLSLTLISPRSEHHPPLDPLCIGTHRKQTIWEGTAKCPEMALYWHVVSLPLPLEFSLIGTISE